MSQRKRTRVRSHSFATLVLALCAAPLAVAAPANAAQPSTAPPGSPPGMERRTVPQKPEHAQIKQGYSHRALHLKFVEGSDFRLRGTHLVSSDEGAERDVAKTLARFPGVRVERLFSRPESSLASEKAGIERKSGRQQADLNLYYRLRLAPHTDAVAAIDALNALDSVEIAYAEPLPMKPPETPDYTGSQDYRGPAEDGLDAEYARGVPGGRGGNVRIIDIEYSWNRNHEDLTKAAPAGALVTNGTPTDPFSNNDHGTAVLGEMIGDDNAFGVTGIADQAAIGLTNASDNGSYDLADAINIAAGALNDGDVILLEQQVGGVNGCDANQVGCVAVEYVQAYYDAIVAATGDGVIVVEAAGNGSEDLDDPAYNPTFGTRADSGAIIVGAANYPGCTDPAHGRRSFSTFGSRVNLHAYGQCVVTTGYGDLQGTSMSNDAYTDTFGGTSSASPMVTSAAAILSSVAQQQGDTDGLTSTEVRTMLANGATPQELDDGALAGNIGPMPDLRDALRAYVPVVVTGDATTPEGTDVTLSALGFDAQDFFGVTYAWDLDNDGQFDDATGSSVTFDRVGQDGGFPVAVQVTDSDGASGTDTAMVTVTNVAPSLESVANDAPVAEGSLLTQGATVRDPGWLEDLRGSIDFGDGASTGLIDFTEENVRPDATGTLSGGHRFGDNGAYSLQVCGNDDDTSTCAPASATVTNVAPSVAIDPTQDKTIDEGDTLTATALFSDPGWLDSYTAAIDWGTGGGFEPVTPAVTTQGSSGVADSGTAAGTHTYGDDGTFTVTVKVTDDDGGVGQDSFQVSVGNVAPTAAIDLSGAIEINGQQTVLSEAGQSVPFSGRSTDPGSDDLSIAWDWDDGAPAPDITTLYLVNPPATDADPSPTVQPRDVTDAKNHAFGQACMYLVTMSSTDDDAGASSDDVNVLITGNADVRRGAGYWYDQYRGKKGNKNQLPVAQLKCYLEIVEYVSAVFNEDVDASTMAKAATVLGGTGPAAPPQLRRELLAAWLNFANGAIALDQLVDTNGDKVADTTFVDALLDAEAVELDGTSTDAEILAAKNVLERINLGLA